MEDVPLFELPRQPQVFVGRPSKSADYRKISFRGWEQLGKRREVDLNSELFGQFFSSGFASASHVEMTSGGARFPNSRPRLIGGQGGRPIGLKKIFDSSDKTRGFCLVERAFNVNSTSEEAWEVILGELQLSDWHFIDLDEREGGINTVGELR